MLSADLSRRGFLSLAALPLAAAAPEPSILAHEHVLVNFKRAEYDPNVVFRLVKPKLDEVAKLGCKRFQECTPNYLGRDPKLLRRLQDATGIEIWTNTGLYSARNHEYLPDFAKGETAMQLARRWVEEVTKGVDGTKPRFIKIGVNRGPLDELDRKIVRAAAITSRETGLTIASHTGNGMAAVEQLEIVQSEKAAPAKFVWVHAYNEKDHAIHEKMARAGAWVEFDAVGPNQLAWHVSCVEHMRQAKLLGRTLVSQDAGYYKPGEPNGGSFRDYSFIYTSFLPKLPPEIHKQLMWDNPRAAYGR